MRAKRLIILLILSLLLGGCSPSGEVENQAHVLVLGVDREPSGGICLTMRIPRIGKAETKSTGGSGEYLVLSAEGDDYSQAHEYLQWAATRDINLSQLRLLAVSEELAREGAFPQLIRTIAASHHLYTAARFVVCQGSAKAFISGQEITIGTRLSSELDAMFDHYAAHGVIPDSTFADLYYASASVYSDPVAIWGFPSEKAPGGSQEAAALLDPNDDQDALVESPSSRYYLGTAVFREGRLVHHLDSAQTRFFGLIAGQRITFGYEIGGRAVEVSSTGSTQKRVTISGENTAVHLEITLNTIDRLSAEEARTIEAEIATGIRTTILDCQRAGVEPFGFAQKAARSFTTLQEWAAFDWKSRFAGAKVEVRIHVKYSEV